MCVCVCVCLCVWYGGKNCVGFVCMLIAEWLVSTSPRQYSLRNTSPSQRCKPANSCLSMWKLSRHGIICGYVYVGILFFMLVCSYSINRCDVATCIYTTWDHSLVISGHQGSSLSLKHGLCVSASLNSLHTAHPPLKTGQGHSTCGRSPEARPWSWGFAKQVESLKAWFSLYTGIIL